MDKNQKTSKNEPNVKKIPVNLWKMEKTAVNTFLWILRCGDKGLLSIIYWKLKIYILTFKYSFFREIQKKMLF